MSVLDPNIIDLEKRLLGEMYGRVGIFTNDSLAGGTLDEQVPITGGISLGSVSAQSTTSVRGKEAIHAKYPNEIEYYACAFELLDSDRKTSTFFSFPIMPSGISIQEPSITNVQKTMGGVVISENPTFIPFNISLNGNFGRRFRKITKSDDFDSGLSDDVEDKPTEIEGNVLQGVTIEGNTNQYSSDYKTGYGSTKMLQKLLRNSKQLDGLGKPRFLVFYNLSFNQEFVVEITNRAFAQSRDSNAIWNYNIQMIAVAPATVLFTDAQLKDKMANLTDFKKKNNDFSNQSEGIKSLLDPNSRSQTTVRRILEKQIRSRAANLVGNKVNNSLNAFTQLYPKDNNNGDNFVINIGEGLLNAI